MKGAFRHCFWGGAWGSKKNRLVVVAMMILGLFCAVKTHAQMNPESLKTDDFSFLRGGVELSFVEAYRVFLKAKAGDQKERPDVPSYEQAARAFAQAAKDAGNPEMEMRCKWYVTFCLFLQTDIATAARAAKLTLHSGSNVHREEIRRLNDVLKLIENGNIATPTQLEEFLEKAHAVERTTGERTIIGKLADMLALAKQTREARGDITGYELRTRLFDQATTKEQLTSLLVIAGLFQHLSINIADNTEKINQAVCAANLRQLGVYLHQYAQDHDGVFPPPYAEKRVWQYRLMEYTGDKAWANRGIVWRCPSSPSDGYLYGINQNITIPSLLNEIRGQRVRISNPQSTMLLADSIHFMPDTYPGKPLYGGAAYKIAAGKEHAGTGTIDWGRHSGGANVLFVDGHVEWRSGSQLERGFWKAANAGSPQPSP